WIAYRTADALLKIQVGGSSPPEKIADGGGVPTAWSPDGKWITGRVGDGIGIISPDGRQKRILFPRLFASSAVGWSRDSATVYLLEGGPLQPSRLSAADVERGIERLIREYPVDGSSYSETSASSARLYPSGDGRYLLSGRWSFRGSIWMIE